MQHLLAAVELYSVTVLESKQRICSYEHIAGAGAQVVCINRIFLISNLKSIYFSAPVLFSFSTQIQFSNIQIQ